MGRVLTPYRAGVTTDGLKHNKYRSRCFGRGACNRRVGRLRHPRRVRFADRADLSGDGHREPDAADQLHRARDPRRHEDRQGARRRVRRRGDAARRSRRRRRSWSLGRVDARVGAAAAAVEVGAHPERHRQLERPRRPQLLRARHGPRRDRPRQGARRQAARRSTTAARAASTSRASGT